MRSKVVPTLFEWIGGEAALAALVAEFYDRVQRDSILAPIFATMGPKHPAHVAAFIGEVFGGPKIYSASIGGHADMIRHHMNRSLTGVQRRQWISLLLDTYADIGLPDDPEFMSALVAYLEWGTRLAVLNSQPFVSTPQPKPDAKVGLGRGGRAVRTGATKMIVEYIRYSIPSAQQADFVRNYTAAKESLLRSPYALDFEIAQCAKDDTQFIIRIEWTSADDHMQKFRASEEFREFLPLIKTYIGMIEEMRHYEQR